MLLAYARIGGLRPDTLEINRRPHPLPAEGDPAERVRQGITNAGYRIVGDLLEALPGSFEAEVQPVAVADTSHG